MYYHSIITFIKNILKILNTDIKELFKKSESIKLNRIEKIKLLNTDIYNNIHLPINNKFYVTSIYSNIENYTEMMYKINRLLKNDLEIPYKVIINNPNFIKVSNFFKINEGKNYHEDDVKQIKTLFSLWITFFQYLEKLNLNIEDNRVKLSRLKFLIENIDVLIIEFQNIENQIILNSEHQSNVKKKEYYSRYRIFSTRHKKT